MRFVCQVTYAARLRWRDRQEFGASAPSRQHLTSGVALEALTNAWRRKRLKLDELSRIAKKLRMQQVMQPYLETVVL
jgi:hypothetical protein